MLCGLSPQSLCSERGALNVKRSWIGVLNRKVEALSEGRASESYGSG